MPHSRSLACPGATANDVQGVGVRHRVGGSVRESPVKPTARRFAPVTVAPSSRCTPGPSRPVPCGRETRQARPPAGETDAKTYAPAMPVVTSVPPRVTTLVSDPCVVPAGSAGAAVASVQRLPSGEVHSAGCDTLFLVWPPTATKPFGPAGTSLIHFGAWSAPSR